MVEMGLEDLASITMENYQEFVRGEIDDWEFLKTMLGTKNAIVRGVGGQTCRKFESFCSQNFDFQKCPQKCVTCNILNSQKYWLYAT